MERGFCQDMVSILMNHQKQNGIESPYTGVVHRLDKMVGGVMVYAKNKPAAGELSRQIAARETEKKYYAVICRASESMDIQIQGNMTDYLVKDSKTNTSRVSGQGQPMAKKAELDYRILETKEVADSDGSKRVCSLAEIKLLTGRHHQIRVQFASRNMPLYGDAKYNKNFTGEMKEKGIALFAHSITFRHPVTKKSMTFHDIPQYGIFQEFDTLNGDT
jgi:23S rRNA pseudouridine1911/1915/1917 synthase